MKQTLVLCTLSMLLLGFYACEPKPETGDPVGSWEEIIFENADSSSFYCCKIDMDANARFKMTSTFKNTKIDSTNPCFILPQITEYMTGSYVYNSDQKRLIFNGSYCNETHTILYDSLSHNQTCYSIGRFVRNYSINFSDGRMLLGYENLDRVIIQQFRRSGE